MTDMLQDILAALAFDAEPIAPERVSITGQDDLPSFFTVSTLAAASIGAAGAMLNRRAGNNDPVMVDRRLASLWFGMTIRPQGWQMPCVWDPIAGDYRTEDGWIRLHTNAPNHRRAALGVLGDPADREAVAGTVVTWTADKLESAIVEADGCAATMRDLAAWQNHPQGAALAKEPLIHWAKTGSVDAPQPARRRELPMAGIRVLDLTRILAGPVAGRFLAAHGADVLRIDPPDWDEPGVIPEVTLGKRCAGLDLKTPDDRQVFERLLAGADVLLHGYRPGALAGLGYDRDRLAHLNPALVDVCLNAYGWTGPWSGRRGFDSLVQMSSGIADYGMRASGADKPVPLPVQALDHATGYLMAALVLRALVERDETGTVLSARLSLARTAQLLATTRRADTGAGFAAEHEDDIDGHVEQTDWGPARRVRFPLTIEGMAPSWDHPASKLRSVKPEWKG